MVVKKSKQNQTENDCQQVKNLWKNATNSMKRHISKITKEVLREKPVQKNPQGCLGNSSTVKGRTLVGVSQPRQQKMVLLQITKQGQTVNIKRRLVG